MLPKCISVGGKARLERDGVVFFDDGDVYQATLPVGWQVRQSVQHPRWNHFYLYDERYQVQADFSLGDNPWMNVYPAADWLGSIPNVRL